ncbi:site-2 protease family protein [Methanomassiliicoccus luminyensis]|uniref:site-2 protease family protein n=1 Tax=Methanomassiliicoccus luminyensis TaxID=1080712 RepID=UPI000363578D|nr:site-2 protease family protein [Methanomassiliicoccus luminyensis]
MRASLRLGRLYGIPIMVHVTFLLILPLFGLSFAFADFNYFGFQLGFGALPIGDLEKLALGLFAAALFFIAVLLHELAHSIVALRNGYVISGITLFFFGGVSEIEKTPPNAPGEAFMAFVGPATSFAIGLVLLPFWYVANNFVDGLGGEILTVMLGLMSFYNLLLGAFNIIPAFPMDGGRVLRSVLAKRVGFMRATRIAVNVGKVIAVVMALVGFLFLNLWLVIIAFFIYMGAGEEGRGTEISHAMEGVSVREIMTSEVSTVMPNMNVAAFMEKMMAERHLGYPVMDGGRLVGMVTLQDAQKVPLSEQPTVSVGQIMSPQVITVSSATPAMDAIQLISSKKIGRLVVVDDDRVVGIISRSDLLRAMEIRAAEKAGVEVRTRS